MLALFVAMLLAFVWMLVLFVAMLLAFVWMLVLFVAMLLAFVWMLVLFVAMSFALALMASVLPLIRLSWVLFLCWMSAICWFWALSTRVRRSICSLLAAILLVFVWMLVLFVAMLPWRVEAVALSFELSKVVKLLLILVTSATPDPLSTEGMAANAVAEKAPTTATAQIDLIIVFCISVSFLISKVNVFYSVEGYR